MIRRLLLSIHDVGPRFEGEVDRLRDLLAARAPIERVALLVVPDHWGSAPLVPGSPFASRLRGWADAGAEVFLHGWFHRDDVRHEGALARLRATRLTAGEGEFLGLRYDEAIRRLRAGRALLEDVTGRPVAGFVAPAWLYGADVRAALEDETFAVAEDHWRVWSPARGGARLAGGPVLTWASRTGPRIASSLLAGRVLPPVLGRTRTARVAVHPGDVRVPALVRSIERAVSALRRTHRVSRYAELLGN